MEKLQITVSSHELLKKLRAVGKVIKPSNVNPLHEYFMFEVEGEHLKVTASDSEGNITTNVDAEISQEIKIRFLIESKLLLNGLKELPEQPITLDVKLGDNVDVNLIHASGHYHLQALSGENFPMIAEDDETTEVTIGSDIFRDGVRSTLPFAGNDELRPVMNSVFIEYKNNHLNFTATNSSVMSVKEFYNLQMQPFSLILPVKISKIISDLAHECSIIFKVGSRNVSVSFEGFQIVYRMIEGIYPNYRSVIPKTNDKFLTVNKREFLGALIRTALFSNQSSSLVKLNIDTNLTLSGSDIDYQISAEEKLNCEWKSHDSLEIGFKSTFMQQCVDAVDSNDVQLSFSDPMRACLISPVDENQESSLIILIMPMAINL